MANFCLPPTTVEKFSQAHKAGEVDTNAMAKMSSEERNAYLSPLVGEMNARGVNALFESKLLLKNQKKGFETWVNKVQGLSPNAKRDLISRINRLESVLDPGEHEAFMRDLAGTRLGVDVSREEAKTIADLSRRVSETKDAIDKGGDKMEWGRAQVALNKYVSDLKNEAKKTGVKGIYQHPGKTATAVSSLAKSTKASLDDSAIFHQGWKTMLTNPITWQKNMRKTFGDFARAARNQDVIGETTAEIITRPNFELYKRAKLATAVVEEEFPTSLPEKIPILGRAFKGSEAAYTAFLHRMRADVFDKYLEIAKKNGVELDDKQLLAMGKMVNSLTGRGHLGGLEPAANTVNSVFFSPRSIKANIDTLTAHQFQKGVTPFVRKEAAKNLLKIVGGTAGIMTIANSISPGSVELDPRSSKFGKIKVGDTTFDISGGMSSVATLAARLVPHYGGVKNNTTGEVKKLGDGFGAQTVTGLVGDFAANKLSPAASVVKDVLSGKDFSGNKITTLGELENLFAPLPVTGPIQTAKDPYGANPLIAGIADALGISTNTYGQSNTKWGDSTSKELEQFKEKVGDQKFQEANDLYNKTYDEWLRGKKEVAQLPPANSVDPKDKAALVDRAKQDIQKYVWHEYGFKYKMTPGEKLDAKKKRQETAKVKRLRGY